MNRMKKNRAAILLLCLVMGLTGCASQGVVTEQVALPAPQLPQAPYNDSRQDVEQTVLLYLPSVGGEKLVTVPVRRRFPFPGIRRKRCAGFCTPIPVTITPLLFRKTLLCPAPIRWRCRGIR